MILSDVLAVGTLERIRIGDMILSDVLAVGTRENQDRRHDLI